MIDPPTNKALSFAGAGDVTITAGSEFVSDPLPYPVAPLSSLAITFHIDAPPANQSGHAASRATSYLAHGNLVSAADLPNARRIDHWYQISGVDVLGGPAAKAIVAFGDSITDGAAATINGNDRWTDFFAQRLHANRKMHEFGVLNEGIGGNRLLTDGSGLNALARFDTDALSQLGVRFVIVLEGTNDLSSLTRNRKKDPADHRLLVERILGAYQQILVRSHAMGLKVLGVTIPPYLGPGFFLSKADCEADRQEINQWIRASGHFDAVLDFDAVLRDPDHPDRLLPRYDSGDHVHPSPSGNRAMADSIPLSFFSN